MKKILTLLLALMAILPASADRYLTFGVNDTLRIKPSSLGGMQNVMVRAHFDGRLDKWDMTIQEPQGMILLNAFMREDMLNIPYINYLGEPDTCSAQLFCYKDYHNLKDSLSASIIVLGYEPNGHGGYDCYGTVKWEPGDYSRMCELYFSFDDFPDTASIYINETLSSTFDQRGFTIPFTQIINKRIFVYVGYLRGDVNGDESINIDDISALTDYILTHEGLDQYQLVAADVDSNGTIDISDLGALVELIQELAAGSNEVEDPIM